MRFFLMILRTPGIKSPNAYMPATVIWGDVPVEVLLRLNIVFFSINVWGLVLEIPRSGPVPDEVERLRIVLLETTHLPIPFELMPYNKLSVVRTFPMVFAI